MLRGIQSITNCCDGDDITGGDQYTDPVVDGVGDVPQNIIDAGYATDAADWTGFADYKCMIAHVMVDQMELRLRKLHTLVDDTGDILGGVAVAVTIITTVFTTILTGGISVMALGIIASTGVGAVLWKAITDATDLNLLADAVATNHEELVCSIKWGDGSADSVENLKLKIDDLFTGSSAIILKNLNLEPTLKALYSGGYDQQDIAQILVDAGYDTADFDCACMGQIGEYLHLSDFEDGGGDSWYFPNGSIEAGGCSESPIKKMYFNSADNGYCYVGSYRMLTNWLGIPDTAGKEIHLNRVSFWHMMSNPGGGVANIRVVDDIGATNYQFTNSDDVWTYVVQTFSPPHVITVPFTGECLRLSSYKTSTKLGNFYIDHISVDYDVVTT